MKKLKEKLSSHIKWLIENNDFLISNKKTTITELAELAGISRMSMYNVMDGTASLSSILSVLKVLDIEKYNKIIDSIN